MIDRQPRDLPLDAHLHTRLSPDSDVDIDVYAAAAVERGIAELAITDHVDFEPGAPAYGYATFGDRERMVRQAAERWAPQGVEIRFGVELTYDRSWEADIRDHLARHAYDFTIGSVHDRVDSPYAPGNVQRWVEGRSLAEVVAPSFDEVEAAARSGLFDALGHL
ncbi:MAG TPA: PHP domain-containing protein, partial [Candidatus Limnocylindrales bacterium]|nr:PHP domain-containing protein [Candidatus Limnocylindrales bacterium]